MIFKITPLHRWLTPDALNFLFERFDGTSIETIQVNAKELSAIGLINMDFVKKYQLHIDNIRKVVEQFLDEYQSGTESYFWEKENVEIGIFE